MRWGRDEQAAGQIKRYALMAAPLLALVLAGCGSGALSSSSLSSLNIFDSNKATTNDVPNDGTVAQATEVECPAVTVRTGAGTLMIAGDTRGAGDAAVMSLKYQGTIIRTARECNVTGGLVTMKIGVEGRIITGPAGGPGNVDVPLRIAVVQEGVTPKPIASRFARIPVTVASENDRVNFSHVESDVTFPMPVPAGDIDAYVVYVGFDTMAAQQQKRAPAAKRRTSAKKG